MKLFYDQIETALLDYELFSIIQIESPSLLLQFCNDLFLNLANNEENFVVSKNSKLLMFSKICDWIDSPWKLNFKNRRLQNNYLKNLSSHIIEDGRDERILHKWNELYNIISEIIENEALVKMNQDHILLDNILKAFNIQASIDYDIELLELLEEYLLFQVKYGEKEIFIISFFSNYLSNDDMIELASFSKREEIYIILIEHYLAPRFSKLPGRYIIIDEDLCEIIITET